MGCGVEGVLSPLYLYGVVPTLKFAAMYLLPLEQNPEINPEWSTLQLQMQHAWGMCSLVPRSLPRFQCYTQRFSPDILIVCCQRSSKWTHCLKRCQKCPMEQWTSICLHCTSPWLYYLYCALVRAGSEELIHVKYIHEKLPCYSCSLWSSVIGWHLVVLYLHPKLMSNYNLGLVLFIVLSRAKRLALLCTDYARGCIIARFLH